MGKKKKQRKKRVSEKRYPVECIKGKKIENGQVYFWVKWLGYADKYNTWEPEQHFFDNGYHLIKEYEESLQSKLPISSEAPSTTLDYSLTLDNQDELTLQVPDEIINDENTKDTFVDHSNNDKRNIRKMEILRKQLSQLTLNVELEDIATLQTPRNVSVMQAMPACTVDIYNNESASNISSVKIPDVTSKPATEIDVQSSSEGEKRVECIISKKIELGEIFYKVKWHGLPENRSTWKPLRDCISELELIYEFESRTRYRQRANIPVGKRSYPSATGRGNFEVESFVEEIDSAPIVKLIEPEPIKPIIESFMDKKIVKGEVYYKVKWLNNYPVESSWRLFRDCLDAINLLREFEDKLASDRIDPKIMKSSGASSEQESIHEEAQSVPKLNSIIDIENISHFHSNMWKA